MQVTKEGKNTEKYLFVSATHEGQKGIGGTGTVRERINQITLGEGQHSVCFSSSFDVPIFHPFQLLDQ